MERNTVPSGDSGSSAPDVNCGLYPLRYQNSPDMPRLALQVRDHPTLIANLDENPLAAASQDLGLQWILKWIVCDHNPSKIHRTFFARNLFRWIVC
jgi:hypothetical protein